MSRYLEKFRQHFRARRVLVTGGLGFIGGHLVDELLAAEADVLVLCKRPLDGRRPPEGIGLVQGDLLDPNVWDRVLEGVETVFHLAAQTSARASEQDPRVDYRLNVEGTRGLLFACRDRTPAPVFVFAGTQTQCGIPTKLPLTGREPDHPASYYDLHKLEAEHLVEYFARLRLVMGTTLRLPTVYGPGARESARDCGVVSHFIERALSGRPLTIYAGGDRARDFLFVKDVATAFLLAACEIAKCNAQHFVIGTELTETVEGLAHLIADVVEDLTGRRAPVTRVPPPDDEPEIATCSFAVDASEFRSRTGWGTDTELREGIVRTVKAAILR